MFLLKYLIAYLHSNIFKLILTHKGGVLGGFLYLHSNIFKLILFRQWIAKRVFSIYILIYLN